MAEAVTSYVRDNLLRMLTEAEQRYFDQRCQKDNVSGCWLWIGSLNAGGYGVFRPGRIKSRRAHRVSYERFVGPIPDGLELDHLCRVRNCVNPAHLEAVTRSVNQLRGETVAARNAAVTHCPRGHPYDEENTFRYRGQRRCRACARERARLRRDEAGHAVWNRDKTECANGHPLVADNVYWVNCSDGYRRRKCRTCVLEQRRRYLARRVANGLDNTSNKGGG